MNVGLDLSKGLHVACRLPGFYRSRGHHRINEKVRMMSKPAFNSATAATVDGCCRPDSKPDCHSTTHVLPALPLGDRHRRHLAYESSTSLYEKRRCSRQQLGRGPTHGACDRGGGQLSRACCTSPLGATLLRSLSLWLWVHRYSCTDLLVSGSSSSRASLPGGENSVCAVFRLLIIFGRCCCRDRAAVQSEGRVRVRSKISPSCTFPPPLHLRRSEHLKGRL